MDFINNIVQGIKEFFSDLGTLFSGGSSGTSTSMMAPTSPAEAYPSQGFDFSQPQMRPSVDTQAAAPIVDHSVQADRPAQQLSSVYNPASNHYGQYSQGPAAQPPTSAVEQTIQREQRNIGRAVDRTVQDIQNFPKALGEGIAHEAERQAISKVGSAGIHFRAGMQRRMMGWSVR